MSLAFAMITARLLDPASRPATGDVIDRATASCSLEVVLGSAVGFAAVYKQELCSALDWLVKQQELGIENPALSSM